MQTIFTPWRFSYISMSKQDEACFLCQAAADPHREGSLVIWQGQYHLVMLNRYPYTNGHLMVAPLDHVADPRSCDADAQAELWPLVLECQRVLDDVYSPGGFNMGLNLGAASGAGVPGHFHFHIVPRWTGDTNFMSVVGAVRLVPEELTEVAAKLRPRFAKE